MVGSIFYGYACGDCDFETEDKAEAEQHEHKMYEDWGPDRQWEDNYYHNSPSVTGIQQGL